VLVFDSSCDPFGTNPHGTELFAIHADGTGLHQLTETKGYTVDASGAVSVELVFPFDYPGLAIVYNVETLAPPPGPQKVNAEADFAHDDRVDEVAVAAAVRGRDARLHSDTAASDRVRAASTTSLASGRAGPSPHYSPRLCASV
jgi:hypothetical protein